MREIAEKGTGTTPQLAETGLSFKDFQLAPDVLEALRQQGIVAPTPIQLACIPAILEGKDVVGKAETGTGKTIGFGAPLVGRIDTTRVAVQALVLTPTRELAQQVAGVLEVLGASRGLGVALVVGGVHASEQVLKLRSRSQLVVGTPGRVLDFLRDRTLSLVWCEVVVLDEADRMLDMGFIDDVTTILDKIPKERQTLLFSATVPPEINKILSRYMRDPVMFSTSSGLSTVDEIEQLFVEAEFRDKFRMLQKVLDARKDRTVIIFCNTRRQAIDLDRMLWGHGYSAGALHGDVEQDVRFKVLESFRKGEIKILVATDVASRGLDIDDVGSVVNYEIPSEVESYVHRIGRTGRAQKSGESVSIVSRKENGQWQRILKETGFKVGRISFERGGRRGGSEAQQPSSRPRDGRGPRVREENGETISAIGQSVGGERFVVRENEDADKQPVLKDTSQERNISLPGEGRGRGRPDGSAGRPPRRRRGRGRGDDQRDREAAPGAGQPMTRQHSPPTAQQPRSTAPHSPSTARHSPTTAARQQDPEASRGEAEDGIEPSSIDAPGVNADESSAQPGAWNPERPQAAKPQRIKLEDVGDDYFKTDYFDIDHSLLGRTQEDPEAPPSLPRPQDRGVGTRPQRPEPKGPAAQGGAHPQARHGGQDQSRSGHGRPGLRPDGHRRREAGRSGQGGPGPRPGRESPPAAARGPGRGRDQGGGQPGEEGPGGQRRRRRRRGRRGRGGGQGQGGGGGAPPAGGA